MAAGNFDRCLARVFVYEGGNDNDPRDPGGRTSRGITQREYDTYLVRVGKAAVIVDHDVWKASNDDIRTIYRINYWDRTGCEKLPAGVDMTIFDSSVNSGVSQCAKWAQRAAGVTVDGDFGPATCHALENSNDNDLLCADILSRRLAMLQSLKTWKFYGKGWSARVANVLKIAQAWATGSVGPDPVNVAEFGGHKKGRLADVKQPLISVTSAQVATGSSAVSAGVANFVAQAQPAVDKITAFSSLQWLGYGLAGLTVVGIAAGVVASIAQARADRARNADGKTEVDPNADEVATSVAVNDNAPPAKTEVA